MARRPREVPFDPPYDVIFAGILSFRDFESAESTLRNLEELRQRFLAEGDKKGVSCCRLVGRRGRHRAELISRNPRVSSQNRARKGEIAAWFRVWLETPELFSDWLAMRKTSREFLLLSRDSSEALPRG